MNFDLLAGHPDDDEQQAVLMLPGSRLLHACLEPALKSIMETGLEAFPNQALHLSQDDEWELVAWYHVLGTAERKGVVTLEVDVSGLELRWPGYDGLDHFYGFETIEPSRLRVVRTRGVDEVLAYLREAYADQVALIESNHGWDHEV